MKNCHDGLLRTASASSWRRRACCSLLGNQLVSQCLRIGDVLLVAVRINPNVWSPWVGLHLLVLAGEVEKPGVRTEENIGGISLPFVDGGLPHLGDFRLRLVVNQPRIVLESAAN